MMNQSGPINLTTGPGVAEVRLGGSHACYRTDNGRVFCWGWNQWMQTGTGVAGGIQSRPTEVTAVTGATQLTAGYAHTCVRSMTNQVLCWGQNVHGQIGNGAVDATAHGTPTVVMGL
jgi:alpha-tubulin suppressor-like RCC1 family protein